MARLSADTVDFKDLHKGYTHCRIPLVEERGITLAQLREVHAHIQSRCDREGWVGLDGTRRTPSTVTMYDVVRYIVTLATWHAHHLHCPWPRGTPITSIALGSSLSTPSSLLSRGRYVTKPCSQPKSCSYIERIALHKQPPVWFVCHWWGDSFERLLECLEQHSRDRGVPDTCAYFLSAFAVNDWSTEATPSELPAMVTRAIQRCIGTIFVLDHDATALGRTWCAYELLCGLATPRHKLDIYTYMPHICVYLTKKSIGRGALHRECSAVGLLEASDFATVDFAACHTNKAHRESFFPTATFLTPLLTMDVATARTSVESDRRVLLNALTTGRADPTKPPPKEGGAIDQLNARLRGRLALAVLRNAAAGGPSSSYQACLSALRVSELSELTLSLSGCAALDASMAAALATSLPSSLTALTLFLRDVDEAASADCVTALIKRLTNREIPKLTKLIIESAAIDAPMATALVPALNGLKHLTEVGLGLPTLITTDAAQALALGAKFASYTFCSEVAPTKRIDLSKQKLKNADIILLGASIANGSRGNISGLNISGNLVDGYGMRALAAAFKSGPAQMKQLDFIDVSDNYLAGHNARMEIMEAAKEAARKGVSRGQTATGYRLNEKYECRIEAVRPMYEDSGVSRPDPDDDMGEPPEV